MYDKLDFLYMAGVCASLFLAAAAYSGRRIGGCTAAMRWFCAAAVSAAATQSFLLIALFFTAYSIQRVLCCGAGCCFCCCRQVPRHLGVVFNKRDRMVSLL
jgi:hypothetical protein